MFSLQSNVDPRDEVFSYHHQFDDKPSSKSEDRKEYNIGVLRHLQVIFGHLAASRLQYYVPRGFWKQFRYFENSVILTEVFCLLSCQWCLMFHHCQVMGWASEPAGAAWCTGIFQLFGGQSGWSAKGPWPSCHAQQSAGRVLCWPEDLSGMSPQVNAVCSCPVLGY